MLSACRGHGLWRVAVVAGMIWLAAAPASRSWASDEPAVHEDDAASNEKALASDDKAESDEAKSDKAEGAQKAKGGDESDDASGGSSKDGKSKLEKSKQDRLVGNADDKQATGTHVEEPPPEAPARRVWPNWLSVLVVAFVFLVPLALGQHFSRRFRMPDHAWRMSIVLFALLASAAITIFQWDKIKLGIDLKGGAILVYEVEEAK